MRAADAFAEHRTALQALMAEIRAMIAHAHEEAHGQTERLEAWCTATQQFLDEQYWHSASDVERARVRAQGADLAARRAAAEARAHSEAHGKAVAETGETTAEHQRRYPSPGLG